MAAPRCPCCTDDAKLTCGECKDVKYCSRECQEADWQFHKVLCKSVKDFQKPPQPGMYRAIYFPHNSKKPEFRWMSNKPRHFDTYAESYAEPDLSGLNDGHIMFSNFVNKNQHTGASMRNWVFIWYDDNFQKNYDGLNKAIEAATAGKNKFKWGGPIFAAKASKMNKVNNVDPMDFTDMDMTSYSDLVAYLIQFLNDTAAAKLYKAPKVKGVKMYCDGEREADKSLPRAVSVDIPRIHPIFDDEGRVSDISRLIGMPLVIRKLPAKLHLMRKCGALCIPAVTYMQRGCDPSKRNETQTSGIANFSWAPMEWTGGHVPNVFISNVTDSQPLQAPMLEAFADFCQYHLTMYFQWNGEQDDVYGPDGIDKIKQASNDKIVMDQMTPEIWERYLMQWRAHQAKKTAKGADSSACSEEGNGHSGLDAIVDRLAQTDISENDADTLMGVSARKGEVLIRSLIGSLPATEEELARYED